MVVTHKSCLCHNKTQISDLVERAQGLQSEGEITPTPTPLPRGQKIYQVKDVISPHNKLSMAFKSSLKPSQNVVFLM